MAGFCFQCNVDMCFGPYTDFRTDFGPLEARYPDRDFTKYMVLCEGCGPIAVDAKGWCIDPSCKLHGLDMPPGRGKVYENALRHVAARSGPYGPLIRVRNWALGTPWDPGEIHCPSTWWTTLLWRLWKGQTLAHDLEQEDELNRPSGIRFDI